MKNSAIGSSWNDVEREIFTSEEIAESNLHVERVGELIKTRKEESVIKNELENLN